MYIRQLQWFYPTFCPPCRQLQWFYPTFCPPCQKFFHSKLFIVYIKIYLKRPTHALVISKLNRRPHTKENIALTIFCKNNTNSFTRKGKHIFYFIKGVDISFAARANLLHAAQR